MTERGTFGTYVQIDPAKLADFLRSPNGPVFRMLIEDGEAVKREAVREAPVYQPPDDYSASHRDRRAGTLRDSIVKRIATENDQPVVLVGSADPVAVFVHEGTQPHIIRARNAPLLVFFWKRVGRVVSFRQVNHPGNQPNRFLLRALNVLRGRH